MTEMRITARASGKEPDYKKTAPMLLELCRAFFREPENEKEYTEWKARKEQDEKTAV